MSVVYSNLWFKVVEEKGYYWVEEPDSINGAAVIVIFKNKLLLSKHKRQAQNGDITWEIPRGYGMPGESSDVCAKREVLEETGIDVSNALIYLLGRTRPNTAILNSLIDIYYIEIDELVINNITDNEALGSCWIPLDEVSRWLREGKVEDGFTLSALALYMAR